MGISAPRQSCDHLHSHTRSFHAARAVSPYSERFELTPTPASRAHAQVKYSSRCHAAYGDHSSRAGAPRHTSRTNSQPQRTYRPRDVSSRLLVSRIAQPTNCLHHALRSFPTETAKKPICAGLRDELRRDEETTCRRALSRAKMSIVPARSVDTADMMIVCDENYSRPLRFPSASHLAPDAVGSFPFHSPREHLRNRGFPTAPTTQVQRHPRSSWHADRCLLRHSSPRHSRRKSVRVPSASLSAKHLQQCETTNDSSRTA